MEANFVVGHLWTVVCFAGMVLLPFVALLFGFYLADRRANSRDGEPPA